MLLQKYVLFVLQLVLLINARNSMNGVYVNGNIALAIVCYSVIPSRGEIMTVISGSISDMSKPNIDPIWVLGWSDSCQPTEENSFVLNLQNKTQDLRTVWYIVFLSDSSLYIQSKMFVQYDGYEAFRYSTPMRFINTNDQIIWLERLD